MAMSGRLYYAQWTLNGSVHKSISIWCYSEIMGCFGLFDGCNEEINDAKAVDDVMIIKIDGADPSSDISGWEQRIEKNGNLSEGNLSEGKLSFGAGICLRLCVVIFLVVVWMVSQEFDRKNKLVAETKAKEQEFARNRAWYMENKDRLNNLCNIYNL
eukprot:1123905_1